MAPGGANSARRTVALCTNLRSSVRRFVALCAKLRFRVAISLREAAVPGAVPGRRFVALCANPRSSVRRFVCAKLRFQSALPGAVPGRRFGALCANPRSSVRRFVALCANLLLRARRFVAPLVRRRSITTTSAPRTSISRLPVRVASLLVQYSAPTVSTAPSTSMITFLVRSYVRVQI